MAARTVVCPECSETLPYGRLSCPACGSLLASVAGGPERQVASASASAPAGSAGTTGAVAAAAGPATGKSAPAADEAGSSRSRRRWRNKQNGSPAAEEPQDPVVVPAARSVPPTAPPAARTVAPGRRSGGLAPSKVGAVTLAARLDASAPVVAGGVPPVLGDWPAPAAPAPGDAFGGPSPWRRDGVQRPRDVGWDDDVVRRRVTSSGNGADGAPATLPPWAGGPRGATMTAERPVGSAGFSPDDDLLPPGAYLPPSGAFTARDSGLARGHLVQPSASPATPRLPVLAALAAAVSSLTNRRHEDPNPEVRPGEAPLLADLPFDSPESFPGWLIAAGSAASIAGFLLPWSSAIPFASGFGYFDTWGLATPSHLLILFVTVGLLALTILPNRVPAWLRNGVAALALGGLLLGIIWPYLMDGYGAMIGVLAEATGAMLLLIGGMLALRPQRHAEDEPVV